MAYSIIVTIITLLPVAFVTSTDADAYSNLFYDNQDVFPLQTWLRGSLVRTGPGTFGNGPRNFTHAFDGFGKIYNWKFYGDGNASFSTNFILSEGYNVSILKNNIDNFLTYESVTPPFSLAERELAVVKGYDNTNVNVYRVFNRAKNQYEYITLTDAWKIYQIDPLSLGTVGPIDANKPITTLGFVNMMSSAHPLPEYNSTDHFTFLTSVSLVPGVKDKLSVIRIKSSHERSLVATWFVDKAPYMHAFSVTPNYVILFTGPYYVNMENILKYANAFDGLDWHPSEKATIYVIKIKTGVVQTFKVPNTYPSHHANAYEEGGNIIMDVNVYKDPFFSKIFELPTVRSPSARQNSSYTIPEIKRYIIDMQAKNVSVSSFAKDPLYPFINNFETPCINENYRHRKHCYVYGVASKKDKKQFSRTALVKKDVCGTNQENMWSLNGHFPVEMWFVPSPNATREDDGILLSPVYDGEKQKSYLLMLDATTMAPVNRAYLPYRVPFTIHGRFFPDLV